MELSLKCLPVGSLPYEDTKSTTRMMVKLFEASPFFAFLPLASSDDNVRHRTLDNVPGFKVKEKKIFFDKDFSEYKQEIVALDTVFNNPDMESLEKYAVDSFFTEKYFQIIERIKPKETVINLLGPFSLSQMMINSEIPQILNDRSLRKLVIQIVAVKALWLIFKIHAISPETCPIIVLEEPLLNKIGDVRRENEEITRETIVNLLGKTIQKIKEYHGAAAVQCFAKCDWSVPIEAGADVISFNAYNHPNNLNIIAEQVNNFLVGGGRINWAIVPVTNENLVRTLTIDNIYHKFMKTTAGLITAGASERLVYTKAMVSIQGDIDKLPLIFAEKALIMSKQLSKKIPFFK